MCSPFHAVGVTVLECVVVVGGGGGDGGGGEVR